MEKGKNRNLRDKTDYLLQVKKIIANNDKVLNSMKEQQTEILTVFEKLKSEDNSIIQKSLS